jgi:dTDP-4-amino-4,6-dideoxygalactose transaminase
MDTKESTTAKAGELDQRRRIAQLGGTTNLGDCLVALRYLFNRRSLIRGPAIEQYEKAFALKTGVRHAFSFSCGRVGLYGLLRILGVEEGDEVLLQVPTHIVVANAIRYVGARPVFVDCTLDTYNMDLEAAEKKITQRTKVLLIQHTFGIPVDMEAALALARRHGLVVIEDCVHALGARYDGKMIGSFGKAAFFSTEETKTISTTMGGMVVTDDPDLAIKIREFQENCPWPSTWLTTRYILKLVLYHFLTQPYVHRYTRKMYELAGRRHPLPRPTTSEELVGLRPHIYEQRLSNAQAALGLRQLARLESNLSHRRAIASLYYEQLSKLGFALPKPPAKAEAAFVRFPVWVKDRSAVENITAPYVVVGTWFTSVLEEAISPDYGDYAMGSCPQAEDAARHLVNLPTHPRVTEKDAGTIVSALAQSVCCR